MTRIRLVASQRWDPTLGCRRMNGVFKHLQTMNRKCLQTPNTRVPNCFWQHYVKLMGLSPSELLKTNVLHAEAFAGPMSLSTGQCHVAEVGSGKLELFHQAKMLRRFSRYVPLVGTQGICHHSSDHQPRCSKKLGKNAQKETFSLCSWIHPLKTAVFDFLSSIRQSIRRSSIQAPSHCWSSILGIPT